MLCHGVPCFAVCASDPSGWGFALSCDRSTTWGTLCVHGESCTLFCVLGTQITVLPWLQGCWRGDSRTSWIILRPRQLSWQQCWTCFLACSMTCQVGRVVFVPSFCEHMANLLSLHPTCPFWGTFRKTNLNAPFLVGICHPTALVFFTLFCWCVFLQSCMFQSLPRKS